MQANKLQFRSAEFEALPGYRRWFDDLLAPRYQMFATVGIGPMH